MWGWLRELYEIRRENRELARHCESCDVLKVELAAERREKQMLLQHALNSNNETNPVRIESDKEEIKPRHVPWRVKQQELETKDRLEHARIMREFKEKVTKKTDPGKTEALEKEMGIAGT